MDKHNVARVLEDISVLLQVKGENPFKIRAYQNAARAIENLDEDILIVVQEKRLEDLPGIGERIARKITQLVKKGTLPYYERLKKSVPESLLGLMNVSGLGGKKIKALYEKLGIKTLDDLVLACQEGKVASLRGFGEKTQKNILDSIEKLEHLHKRVYWWRAIKIAHPIYVGLSQLKEVKQVEIAGSVRRKLETIGDLDILVASREPEAVMDWFTEQKWVVKVLAKGMSKSSILVKEGLKADLRVIPPEQFAFSLLYFTGSRPHNIKLRHLANELGYTLNEYTLAPLKDEKPLFSKRPRKPVTEEDIYAALNLPFIPPEMREDMGEIEAAIEGRLPTLIEEKDIRGVFHCHTTDSDGHNTLEEMVGSAEKYGWEYIGISDHSKDSYQANGMDEKRLFDQLERIRKLNKKRKFSIHVFAGLECDILKDGTLDFPDVVLKELDYVIASAHRRYKLNEAEMTRRLIKAIENPYTTIVGHVTGRLLLRRDPLPLNMAKVIDACIANGKIMELNAQPARLDMDWRYWIKAVEKGLKCCINPDAHSTWEIRYYLNGVQMARKGWLEKKDVINTLSLEDVKAILAH